MIPNQTRNIVEEVFAERVRQVDVKGFTPAGDDLYEPGTLARAACTYALPRSFAVLRTGYGVPPLWKSLWPWKIEWLKLKSRRRDLVRAAALLIAEIEHLDRAEHRQNGLNDD